VSSEHYFSKEQIESKVKLQHKLNIAAINLKLPYVRLFLPMRYTSVTEL